MIEERCRLDWYCRAFVSLAFITLFAIGQCIAQNSSGASAPNGSETLMEPEIPAAFDGRPDTNASGTSSVRPEKSGFMADRVKARGRKFPMRDSWTAIGIVEHVNGLFGGLEQGAGPGFGVELTTADSIPSIELRAAMLTSDKLYRRFEGEVNIPKIIDEKTHADFWYGYLRRTKDNYFGIGGAIQYRHTKSLAVRFDVATSQDGQRIYLSVSRGF
jgi:hypothetical protein